MQFLSPTSHTLNLQKSYMYLYIYNMVAAILGSRDKAISIIKENCIML